MVTSTPTHAVAKSDPDCSFQSVKKKSTCLNWQRLKNTPLMATMGNMSAAACFKTCLDLKDVWDHSWGKWTRLDFPMLLFSTLPTGNENLFAGHWWVVGRHTYLCLAKKKIKIKHANCWQLCYVEFQKIVCILNGVCCAIVHLHC